MGISKAMMDAMRKPIEAMSKPQNFYASMFAENEKKSEENPSSDSAVVQDEAIGKPWTKKFIVYVNEPGKGFADSLKAMEGVVAVYEKDHGDKQDTARPAVPNV